ncbi:hypothetical protein PR048_007326 [Dryococelus australis]|uniref:Uncharacterized protein n=1 Tax=Dryococelus australis TaxID=614101 RepID=A0ABQ9IDA3_9NEOP|nr:hypothetical protein PR048_007326 [Dryococelus australis]
MLGFTRQDKKKATDIRLVTKVKDILEKTATLRWQWAGHVAWTKYERMAKTMLGWSPINHRRPRGRLLDQTALILYRPRKGEAEGGGKRELKLRILGPSGVKELELSKEQRSNERAGETGDSPRKPPTRGIVRHNSHMRKSGMHSIFATLQAPPESGGHRTFMSSRDISVIIRVDQHHPGKVGRKISGLNVSLNARSLETIQVAAQGRGIGGRNGNTGSRDWGKEAAIAFVREQSQHSIRLERFQKTGNRTRDLPNASPVCYHCATSLGVYSNPPDLVANALSWQHYRLTLAQSPCYGAHPFWRLTVAGDSYSKRVAWTRTSKVDQMSAGGRKCAESVNIGQKCLGAEGTGEYSSTRPLTRTRVYARLLDLRQDLPDTQHRQGGRVLRDRKTKGEREREKETEIKWEEKNDAVLERGRGKSERCVDKGRRNILQQYKASGLNVRKMD